MATIRHEVQPGDGIRPPGGRSTLENENEFRKEWGGSPEEVAEGLRLAWEAEQELRTEAVMPSREVRDMQDEERRRLEKQLAETAHRIYPEDVLWVVEAFVDLANVKQWISEPEILHACSKVRDWLIEERKKHGEDA